MKSTTFKAYEELQELYGIERCPECHCSTGEDTEYKDFSNKRIAICAQCKFEWYLDELAGLYADTAYPKALHTYEQ